MWKLISSVNLPLFERFKGDAFFRSSPHAKLNIGATKVELFVLFGYFGKEDIVLVAEARALYGI